VSLNCLHTFCGACSKEWFEQQARTASPHAAPNSPIFTCPTCRDPVTAARHDAKVASLLGAFLKEHPERRRAGAEEMEMQEKYRPGDQVLPRVSLRNEAAKSPPTSGGAGGEARGARGARRFVCEICYEGFHSQIDAVRHMSAEGHWNSSIIERFVKRDSENKMHEETRKQFDGDWHTEWL